MYEHNQHIDHDVPMALHKLLNQRIKKNSKVNVALPTHDYLGGGGVARQGCYITLDMCGLLMLKKHLEIDLFNTAL